MKKVLFFVLSMILISLPIVAQELDVTVTVNNEQLPTASRDRLETFKDQIQNYLNNNKFTGKPWQGEKIKCNFTIFFTGASDDVSYSAQIVVASQRPIEGTDLNSLVLSIMDNSWSFKYEKGQAMYFNQSDFDPLTSLLDYYAYIIIGFDADSFYNLGGTEYFQKALDIAAKGGSSKYAKGWQIESTPYNRRVLVDNLLNTKYQQFRSDYFQYHYNGLDLLNTKDKQTGINNMISLIKNLEKAKDQIDWRSVLMKVFFDAKAGEFVERLKGVAEPSIFVTLKRIDASHTSKYEEALN